MFSDRAIEKSVQHTKIEFRKLNKKKKTLKVNGIFCHKNSISVQNQVE